MQIGPDDRFRTNPQLPQVVSELVCTPVQLGVGQLTIRPFDGERQRSAACLCRHELVHRHILWDWLKRGIPLDQNVAQVDGREHRQPFDREIRSRGGPG